MIEDEEGVQETFDEAIFTCNANQTLMILDNSTFLERHILSSIRYDSELHNHAVVPSDSRLLPDNEVRPLKTRSNHIEQYGARPAITKSRTSRTTSGRGPIGPTGRVW